MIIVKIGGGDKINIEGTIKDLAKLDEKFIIVHGANALRDEIGEQLGKPKKTITSASGYSSVFSDKDALDVMMMAYSGLRNKRIVELCQQNNINAIGLTGLDGKLIQGKRNRGIRVKKDNKLKIVRDFSGKPRKANKKLLELLLNNGFVPVITVPIIDEKAFAINSENDNIVRVIHNEIRADKIIQLIEAPGFLDDLNDPSSLVEEICAKELDQRLEQVKGRMKRKILAIKKLFESAPTEVIITDGRIENPITNANGTVIR
ncbi:MAG: [LysW]-aminoadipate/[LysW]-glutamate kinase [Candidatus Woesearchaeota archaeon]|nr:[LysW]-aminoadipate/[LysW]-glutamate kinase [Candidatus Woesearchaeota archaeon]